MPSLISSRQTAGQPTARAIWWASVVLPEPGGPLTIIRVGVISHPFCNLRATPARNNLAAAYKDAGNLSRAVSLFEITLAERERVLGSGHPDTLTSRNNLVSPAHPGVNTLV
jgi:hypothetical protein